MLIVDRSTAPVPPGGRAGAHGKVKGTCLTSWLGILLMREAGGVPVRRIICCSWFISTVCESRGNNMEVSRSQIMGSYVRVWGVDVGKQGRVWGSHNECGRRR